MHSQTRLDIKKKVRKMLHTTKTKPLPTPILAQNKSSKDPGVNWPAWLDR